MPTIIMPTIIIPAYNEEKNISECLTPFLDYAGEEGLEVIVVCNGCKDSTADVVKKLSHKFICLETDIPSKTNALNLGEQYANYYPRVYLDADVVISIDAVKALIHSLEASNYFACSMIPRMNTSRSSWFVRGFYDVWLSLPYCKAGMIGSGVYALSEKGRARFDKFPDVIADDGYVRCLFKEGERAVVKEHHSNVTAPKNICSLIKIKTRSRLGGYQLRDKFPELMSNEFKDYRGAFNKLIFDYKMWPKLIIYIGVNFISRIRANFQYVTKQTRWERDESSRQ